MDNVHRGKCGESIDVLREIISCFSFSLCLPPAFFPFPTGRGGEGCARGGCQSSCCRLLLAPALHCDVLQLVGTAGSCRCISWGCLASPRAVCSLLCCPLAGWKTQSSISCGSPASGCVQTSGAASLLLHQQLSAFFSFLLGCPSCFLHLSHF